MGKNKKSKIDFQKTKLRVGRRILKNRNLTDTKFKSKKIVLKEQLKNFVDHPDAKVKVDIVQLIKTLDHHISRKTSSLNKIKQLLEADNSLAFMHMPILLRKICSQTLDYDGDVRKEAFGTLDVLFCCVSEEQVKTEFSVLKSYVLCGGSHLDENVRDDSLKFLDLVLDYYPRSIYNSCRIFKSILDLVSHCPEQKTGLFKRKLNTNPGNKITAQQWRVEVLKRLIKMLEVNTNDLNKKDELFHTHSDSADFSKHSFAVVRHFSLEPKTPYCIEPSDEVKTDSMNSNISSVMLFLQNIMNLLENIWREAVPLIPLGKSDVTSQESADVIAIVSQSMCSIMEWVNALCKQCLPYDYLLRFKDDNSSIIQACIMPKFPYTVNKTYRKSQRPWRMGEQTPVSTLNINLLICKVYSLYILGTNDCIPSHHGNILDYLSFIVSNLDVADFADVSNFLTVLNMFISESEPYDYEPILVPLLKYYMKETHVKELIRNFFFTLVMEPKLLFKLEGSETLKNWLKIIVVEIISLAKAQEIDDSLINIMKKITCFGLPAFMESLSANAKNVISLLFVEDERIKELSLFLFSKLPTIGYDNFFKLSIAIHRSSLSLKYLDHLFSFLMLRMQKHDSGISQEDFLCFLFNVAMGRTVTCAEELVNNQGRISQSLLQHVSNGLFSHVILPSQDWSRERDVLDLVMTVLKRIPFEDVVANSVGIFIETILSSMHQIPINRVCGLLQFYTHFMPPDSANLDLETGIANIILAACLYEIELFNLPMKEQNKAKFSMNSYLCGCRKNYFSIIKTFLDNLHLMKAMDSGKKAKVILQKLIRSSPVCPEMRNISIFLKSFDVTPIDNWEACGNQLLLSLPPGNYYS